ncbi:MAG TPA: aryl-sulfate sulfotransferase [Gemmatimonadaceae bacterium]|nr:aryl-sulfate sulfotransferase [Gemmatimonadaceae bacterium]
MTIKFDVNPTRRTTARAVFATVMILLVAAACSDDDNPIGPDSTFAVADLQLKPGTEAGPLAVATFTAQGADSARAWFAAPGGDARATAFFPVADGNGRVLVTGLDPSTDYEIYVEARAGADSGVSEKASYTTDALPEALKSIRIDMSTGTFPSGYILTEAEASDSTLYALAFDSTGKIVWYRHFPDHHQILDFQQQPNGHYTIYLGTSTGKEPVDGEFAEFTTAGDITHTWKIPGDYYTDPHEIRFLMQDTTVVAAFLFGYDQHELDMTGHGGTAHDMVSVHQIFRLSPSGEADLLFDAMNRWTPDDFTSPPLTDKLDMDHPNSLDFDSDGNLVVSWRSLGAITKHDVNTGEVIWQLGGTKSDFTIEGDPLNGFSGQHFARILPDNHILLYDNGTGHDPNVTRPVEYALDTDNMTATMTWDYLSADETYTTYMGSAQRLPDGNTLVGYSTAAIITLVDPNGTVLAQGAKMDGNNSSIFYRALWVPRL